MYLFWFYAFFAYQGGSMAQDSLNDAFFGSDKNYVKKLRELGFYRSQVDNYGILSRAGSPDIPLTHYCRALQAFGPGLFNDLGDQEKFFSRYAKMDEAKENYLSMIIETFKRNDTFSNQMPASDWLCVELISL